MGRFDYMYSVINRDDHMGRFDYMYSVINWTTECVCLDTLIEIVETEIMYSRLKDTIIFSQGVEK